MRRGIRLIFALGAVALLGGLYAAVCLVFPSSEPEAPAEREELLRVDPKTARKIEFTVGGEELCLEKKDGFWLLAGEEDFPVDQDIPKNMLAIVSPLIPLREVSAAPEDEAVYGLDSPVSVTVTDGNGAHSFLLGDECAAVEGYYLCAEENSPVYLVELSVGIAYCHRDRYGLIQTDPHPKVDEELITKVSFRTPEQTIALVKISREDSADSDPLWVWETAEGQRQAEGQVPASVLEAIGAFRFDACVEHRVDDLRRQELFPEGLGFTVEYLHKGKDEAGKEHLTPQRFTLWLEAAPVDEEYYRCNLSSSSQLCTVQKRIVEQLWELL